MRLELVRCTRDEKNKLLCMGSAAFAPFFIAIQSLLDFLALFLETLTETNDIISLNDH